MPSPSTPSLPPEWVRVIRGTLGIRVAENGGELPADVTLHIAAALAPLLAEWDQGHRDALEMTGIEGGEVIAELQAEARRLREALEEIDRWTRDRAIAFTKPATALRCCGSIAKRALSASPVTEPEQEGEGPATILVSTLRQQLAEMELHDDLPDSHDIGYMACWRELSRWLDDADEHAALPSSSSEEGGRAGSWWLLFDECDEPHEVVATRAEGRAAFDTRTWVSRSAEVVLASSLQERLTSDEVVDAVASALHVEFHGDGAGCPACRLRARSAVVAMAAVLSPVEEREGR